MADSKISTFPAVETVDGSEDLAAVKAGANVRVPVDTMVANLDLVKVHRTGGVPDYLMDSDNNQLSVVDAAPKAAEFVTYGANATLTGERVLTASTSITLDTSVAGQIIPKRAAVSGAVTIPADSNTASIPDATITTAMIQLNAVGNARQAKGPANSMKCNPTNASADLQDLSIGTNSLPMRGTGNIASHTIGGGLYIDGTTLKSKSSWGLNYKFSTSTSVADPGSGNWLANNATIGSVTTIAVDDLAASALDSAIFWGGLGSGGKLMFMSGTYGGSAYGMFDVSAVTAQTGYRTITVSGGVGTLPSNSEECVLFYFPSTSGGITLNDVKQANFVQLNAQNQLTDKDDVVVAGTASVADQAALLALDPAVYENYAVIVESGLNRSVHISNGTAFGAVNGAWVQATSRTPGDWFVLPGNVTWSASNNGSGNVRLTSDAPHGIAEADAEGSLLWLISGGTGWTALTAHRITPGSGYVSPTELDLNTAYTASMGVPVFARASGTEANAQVIMETITLPILKSNAEVVLEFEIEYGVNAATSARRAQLYLESTKLNSHNITATNTQAAPYRWGFRNQGTVNAQRAIVPENSSGYTNSANSTWNTAAVDTGVAGKVMTIRLHPEGAGYKFRVNSWNLTIRG